MLARIFCLLLLIICSSASVFATSVTAFDGSSAKLDMNGSTGNYVRNVAFVTPYLIFYFVLYAQLGGLVLVGLPLRVYHGLRKRWPQSPAMRHRVIVIGSTLALLLVALALMRSDGTVRLKDILPLFLGSVVGYGLIALSDFLVIRRIWQRFTRLPRWLRPVTAFLLPLFVAWLVVQAQQALIRATMTTYAYPPPLPVPQFRQSSPTPPPPPNAPPDQPSASPPPHLTLPPEAQE